MAAVVVVLENALLPGTEPATTFPSKHERKLVLDILLLLYGRIIIVIVVLLLFLNLSFWMLLRCHSSTRVTPGTLTEVASKVAYYFCWVRRCMEVYGTGDISVPG